jgi:RNA polymerase sigma-70 factor (ECF subfamily)
LDSACEQSVPLCGPDIRSKDDFEAFVKEHMKLAYSTALGLVGNREDALELSQEAFFRAYQHYDQLSAAGKFFPWFYQILRNLCFSHLRKRRVRRAHETKMEDAARRTEDRGQRTEDGDACCPPSSDLRHPADTGDCFDPALIVERNESKDRIWRAIGQLDEKHREVIILRHFQNLSYDDMAKLLFCNRGTVTSRLFYARQRLKEILDQESGSLDHVAGPPNAMNRVGDPDQPPSAGKASPPGAGVPHKEPEKGGQML